VIAYGKDIDKFFVNPVIREHIDAALKEARLLNYRRADVPVFPFAPVDLGELGMCETLRETHGPGPFAERSAAGG
jgi:hypothetical protein